MHTRTRSLAALLVACSVVLAACGDDGTDTRSGATTSTTRAAEAVFPVTVEGANGEVVIDARPERIVSLSPTATEMLFAIGAGDQVVAADEFSNYPSDAPTTELSGYQPNVEAIAAYEPDLVIMQDVLVVDELAALDVPQLVQLAATNVHDTYAQLEQLGTATGHGSDAAAVVTRMRADIEEIVADVATPAAPLSYYYELDDTYYSLTSATFVGAVFELAGLVNIADAADDGTSYPQLSAEHIVQQDPDLIFLADTKCCGQSAETVAARPGWGDLTAVTEGNVVPLDDDIASRWGPRVVELLRTVVDAVAKVAANA